MVSTSGLEAKHSRREKTAMPPSQLPGHRLSRVFMASLLCDAGGGWCSCGSPTIDLSSLFWRVMIKPRQISCRCKVDLSLGSFLYSLGNKSLRGLNPSTVCVCVCLLVGSGTCGLGLAPVLMGFRQYSFCRCSPLNCLVVVPRHLKELIPQPFFFFFLVPMTTSYIKLMWWSCSITDVSSKPQHESFSCLTTRPSLTLCIFDE